MNQPPPVVPGLARSLVLTALALGTAAVLVSLPGSSVPPADTTLLTWWNGVGTDRAAMSLLRLAGLAMAAWLGAIATLGNLAALTRSARSVRLWHRLAPESIRRAFVSTAIVVSASTPGIAGAAEGAEEIPVLLDLGPGEPDRVTTNPMPVLTDLGPVGAHPTAPVFNPPESIVGAPVERPAIERPAVEKNEAEEWTVERGDHLWRIAEATLADRGSATSDRDVADYWRQLIDTNRDAIGPDVDLIHPGLVLQLPE